MCTTCGSTLAEYRDFKKPDELGEIGVAKPLEPSIEPSFEAPAETFSEPSPDILAEPPAPTITEELPPVDTTPLPSFDVQESYAQPQPDVSSQPSGTSISSIVGMSVYDENARKLGTAKQVGVNASQSLVLVITRNDGSEISVPWNKIKKVGDVVLLGTQESSPQIAQAPPQQAGQCSNCGFTNKSGSKFCEQCGTKI